MATPAQVKALYALTKRQNLALPAWLNGRCQVDRPHDLTLRQASLLIDELKKVDGAAAG
jgi:hypothetical protein